MVIIMKKIRAIDKSIPIKTKDGVYPASGKWRSKLTVTWGETVTRKAVVIGINPSKGNDKKSDRTLTLTARYLHMYGFDEFVMLNIFEYYSTNPKGIDEKSKTDFSKYLDELEHADIILIAWGISEKSHKTEKEEILKILEPYRNKLYCVENKSGKKPLHPRRINYEFDMVRYI